MEVLGYSLSWMTSCFIDGGCGASQLFGHTNGNGDFVLLDRLEPPWPVHECYLLRFELYPRASLLKIGNSRSVTVPSSAEFTRPWDHVVSVQPTVDQYWKEIDILATVVDTFDSLGEWRCEFRNVYGPHRARMHDQVHRSRCVVRLVTGNGEEYIALYDPAEHKMRFRDLVAARLKVKPLLDDYVFFVVNAKRFRG